MPEGTEGVRTGLGLCLGSGKPWDLRQLECLQSSPGPPPRGDKGRECPKMNCALRGEAQDASGAATLQGTLGELSGACKSWTEWPGQGGGQLRQKEESQV